MSKLGGTQTILQVCMLHFLGMAQERIQSKTRQYLKYMKKNYHVSCISLYFESHDLVVDVMNKFWQSSGS